MPVVPFRCAYAAPEALRTPPRMRPVSLIVARRTAPSRERQGAPRGFTGANSTAYCFLDEGGSSRNNRTNAQMISTSKRGARAHDGIVTFWLVGTDLQR